MEVKDFLLPFIFDNHPVRGQWLRLEDTFQKIRSRTDYPDPLASLLAEALASVAFLGGVSKHDGNISLQFQSAGPIQLISVRLASGNKLRGLLTCSDQVESEADLTEALGKGVLAVTYTPGDAAKQYQSIIEIEGASIANAVEAYFGRSEQLPTRIYLSSGPNHISGLMLQVMPEEAQKQAESWRHLTALADTLTEQELMSVHHETLLQQLFHQEDIRLLPLRELGFGCGCSRVKMQNAVYQMGPKEAEKCLAEHDSIEVTCDFCGQQHHFDSDQVETLFQSAPE